MNRRGFLKTSGQAALWVGLAGLLPGKDLFSPGAASFDLVIRNGTIVDGLRDGAFRADIGISGEQIKALGNLGAATAKSVIDASEKIVSPGFIDIHSHTGIELLVNPKGESKIRQGVTTELSGNCGGSEFPFKKELGEEQKTYLERLGLKVDWVNAEGYLARLSREGIGLNHATLIGHGTLRDYVMGEERRPPTPMEMDRMKAIIAEALEQGAFGLSTGLEYAPSGFADTQEIIELCRVVSKYGGFYATHIRSEDSRVMEALAEALYIAEAAAVPLQISHFKVCGTTYWWKMGMMIDLVERARERGVKVTADAYPYLAYSTGLSVFFPQWALDGGDEAFIKRLMSPEERHRMKAETMEKLEGTPWENILLIDMNKEENKHLVGQTIGQAAAAENQDPYEFSCNLLVAEGGNASIIGFGMSEENTIRVLKHPHVMICSDGSALAPYGGLHGGMPHPRNYGTFPRFLGHYVREKKILALPEAIKKITSMPAAKLGLKNRGSIKEGYFADVVVFDPAQISDKATYIEPEQYPAGIDYVIVNGKIVIDHDRHTEALPGRVLFGPGRKT